MTGSIIAPFIDDIVRVHTDGFYSKKELDITQDTSKRGVKSLDNVKLGFEPGNLNDNNNNIIVWVELDGEPNKPIKVISKEDIADVEDYILIHPRFKDRFTLFNLVQVERTIEGVETEGGVLDTDTILDSLEPTYHKGVGPDQIRLRIKLVQPPQTSSSHKRKGMDDNDETLSQKYESLKKYTRILEMDNEAKDKRIREFELTSSPIPSPSNSIINTLANISTPISNNPNNNNLTTNTSQPSQSTPIKCKGTHKGEPCRINCTKFTPRNEIQ
ncbi:hypothetical protein DLAC_03380 [Tieghemostelium lacteum]|uniref:Uncharacterized protein n=1 Tax=Tieghemostelium lacteum TaxID=361077 RepID=A0A152A1U4_TIELA|nr:hypothetical protein DLAC_03380 [Tieghemostelium lacteum]|eukprot:KYR00222.1 hypothetical protein DLAC_03380 [Tieghemostelium lacteum]